MAPAGTGVGLSAKRQQFAGPTGLKGIVHNGKTSAIALFASLGGLVYGCMYLLLENERLDRANASVEDNQGMFAQILTMRSFIDAVRPPLSIHE